MSRRKAAEQLYCMYSTQCRGRRSSQQPAQPSRRGGGNNVVERRLWAVGSEWNRALDTYWKRAISNITITISPPANDRTRPDLHPNSAPAARPIEVAHEPLPAMRPVSQSTVTSGTNTNAVSGSEAS